MERRKFLTFGTIKKKTSSTIWAIFSSRNLCIIRQRFLSNCTYINGSSLRDSIRQEDLKYWSQQYHSLTLEHHRLASKSAGIMTSSVRTLTFFAWSLTLSLLVLKVHSNVSGTVQPQCAANERCMGTSGCFPLTTRRTSPSPQLTNMRPYRHRHLSHYSGLVSEFQILLATYIEAVLNVTTTWNNEDRHVPVLERGLRNLYPMSNETELYTSAGSGDEHWILRESRWLLTSAEAHVQLLRAVNYTGTDVFHRLESIARHRSVSFTHLLAVFHVTGLPGQATCVRTSVSRTASLISHRAEFTTMALRDIHQALVRVHRVLGSCETRWLDRDLRRPKLQCFEASVFYPTIPQGLRFLYNYSEVLAPYDDSAQ